jgi:hypothetical protein
LSKEAISQFVQHTARMRTLYHRHRFPAEIIGHCVWLYFRFALNFRDADLLKHLKSRSITIEDLEKLLEACSNQLRLLTILSNQLPPTTF